MKSTLEQTQGFDSRSTSFGEGKKGRRLKGRATGRAASQGGGERGGGKTSCTKMTFGSRVEDAGERREYSRVEGAP